MIELLHPDIRPIGKVGKSFIDEFIRLSEDSDYMLMTSGYISEDAIFFLKQNINNLPRFDLSVGMHGIEGFTKSQYYGLVDLNSEMIHVNKGMSFASDSLKFHGKAYSFFKDNRPYAALVGSTNISILGEQDKRQFEIDLLFDDPKALKNIVSIQRDFLAHCKEIDKLKPKFIAPNAEPYISQIQKVSSLPILKITKIDVEQAKNLIMPNNKFELTLSCEDKSSLNVPFGRGRGGGESGRGKITKRSWLEGEAIIPKSTTSLPNYPAIGDEFWVITDDGWSFKCKVSGTNAKNFRSKGDLHIFGSWLKGRLAFAEVVKYGQKITKDMLSAYGRESMTLAKTSLVKDEMPIYFLDYSPSK